MTESLPCPCCGFQEAATDIARHLRAGARSALLDPIGSERSVNEYAKQDGQPRIFAAENALDAERINWAEKQYADGLHIEKGCSGSFSGGNLKIEAAVFIGNKEYRAPTIREAMDEAMMEQI